MRHYIGIDLGTTNSAICSFDGVETQVWKSPEQSDVTPSAIYIDKRGHRYYGRRAYEMAPMDEKNSATLFKRYMGTSKVFRLENGGVEMTPEACSAELLRVMFNYLPQEIREDPETVAVITVPAAFNQMKKDATLSAAREAGIGQVALMQEPVAAVMSVLKRDSAEKLFLVYDLGGGTFDISVAENLGGRVNLLTQGGKEMCGGRDWDRQIYRRIVLPWLQERFRLPQDQDGDPEWRGLKRLALFAAEQAKIELSTVEATTIRVDEYQLRMKDLQGQDLYLDVPITRDALNDLIRDIIAGTVEVTRDTLHKAGVSASDVEQIVFVGGPTMYRPLREMVTSALNISAGVEVNPMTAVAEGAAIFAESIDWSDVMHTRKAAREAVEAAPDVRMHYDRRTSGEHGRIAFILQSGGSAFAEITSLDNGWTSGRMPIQGEAILEVPLMQRGDNAFSVALYDAAGKPIPLDPERVVITRTLATVTAIPASHPIAVKALERAGGPAVPVYLVEENDRLPKRGSVSFKAAKRLPAGSSDALVFTLWEGGIRDPIEDNRYIGTFRIPGTSFYSGIIPAGAEIICEYEMNESGTLHLGVSIPSVGVQLNDQNFYSRFEGQTDLDDIPGMIRDANALTRRVTEISNRVQDPELLLLRRKVIEIKDIVSHEEDPEALQAACNDLLDGHKSLARIRRRHLREIRRMDLDRVRNDFDRWRNRASNAEIASFDAMYTAAEMSIERGSSDFDTQLQELRGQLNAVLWQQDSIIQMNFLYLIQDPTQYTDRARFDRLKAEGSTQMENKQFDDLRITINRLWEIRKHEPRTVNQENMLDDVSIIRG